MTGQEPGQQPGHLQSGGLINRPGPDQGTWTADELQEALRRIEALQREISVLEHGLRAQHSELTQLHEVVRTVDGRTLRHEHQQDASREVRDTIAQIEERVEAEASLRRDLAASVERQQEREQRLEAELHRVLEVVASRLDAFAGREAATADRQRSLQQELAQLDRGDLNVAGRLEALEQQIGALRETDHHVGQDVARVASALQPLLSTIESLESRTRTIQADQRRIDDEVAAVRAVRDREDALLDLVEQQRATRARLEDRVSRIEAALEGLRQSHGGDDDSVGLLRRQLQAEVAQRRVLEARVEAQHEVILDHLRRQQRKHEDDARREIEEIERQVRVDRMLIARLQEQANDAEQEQPL